MSWRGGKEQRKKMNACLFQLIYDNAHRCSHASAGAHPILFLQPRFILWKLVTAHFKVNQFSWNMPVRGCVFVCLCVCAHNSIYYVFMRMYIILPLCGVSVLNVPSSPPPIRMRKRDIFDRLHKRHLSAPTSLLHPNLCYSSLCRASL